MSSHDELVMEMATLEKMSVQERLKHARKRRAQQLKRYHQSDKEFTKRQRKNTNQMGQGQGMKRHVTFAPNVELLEAAARGDIDEVRYKLENGVDPNIGNEDGLTALHQSCIDNNEGMMRVLVENGADVNVTDRELWTPLHAASTCGHKHLAQFLISRGAHLLAINSDGNMPYDICEDEATLDYIESQMAAQGITQDQIDELREVLPNEMLRDLQELYKNGGDLEYKDSVGATALHIAVANGYDKVVQYLLSHNIDVSAKDNDGWQPIHAAVCWAQADIIQMLVEAGADLDARTNNDETPLSICEDEEIRSLIQQLKTEIQSNRIKPSNLVRRSSSRNKRGSSIRRSSKREKGEMRKLDARGEAAYIQSKCEELEKSDELPATNIDDVPVAEETNGEVEKSEENEENELENGEDGRVTPMPVITEELSDHPESPRNKKMANNGDVGGGDHGENEVQENGKTENGDVDNDSVDGGTPTIANQKRLVSILKKRSDDDLPPRTDKSKKDKKEDREKEKQKQKEKEKMERQRLKEEKAQRRKEEEQRKKEKKKSKIKSGGGGGGNGGSKDEQYFQERAGGETLSDLKQKRSSINSQPGSPREDLEGPESPDNSENAPSRLSAGSTDNPKQKSPRVGRRLLPHLPRPATGRYSFDPLKGNNSQGMNGDVALDEHNTGPSDTEMKRFSGTSEVIGEEDTRNCCIIS